MAEYVAGRGTTALGIIGTALGGLAAAGGNVGGLLGGAAPANAGGVPVNRYEMEIEKQLAQREAEIVYWRGQDTTNQKISDAYAKLETKIGAVEAEVRANKDAQCAINAAQAVYNGTNTATIACLQNQVATLQGLTKTIVPIANVCPQPMPQYNSWTAPTAG